jgi:hypothetical protein
MFFFLACSKEDLNPAFLVKCSGGDLNRVLVL